MRIFKKVALAALALALVFGLNAAATYAFEPYGSKSELMWSDYRSQDSIDTIFVGDSVSVHAFDPHVVDVELGTSSFNMSTPGQTVEESFMALQKACADHEIKTVTYGLEFCNIQGDEFPDPGRAFIRNKNAGDPVAQLKDTFYCLSNERCYKEKNSLNWMFPWVSNHVKWNAGDIAQNIRMRSEGLTVRQAAEVNQRGWTYFGKGYGNIETRFDFNEGEDKTYADVYERKSFDNEKLRTLAQMCDYCTERDIDFYVVIPPVPAFSVLSCGNNYFDLSRQVEKLVREHGGECYDLNLAKPELLDSSNGIYYADYQHLNAGGGAAVSLAYSKLIKTRESGEDVRGMFYSQDQYEQAHQYVDLVQLDATCEDGSVKLAATAYAGKGTPVEYQFCVKDATGTWQVVRDWSDDSSFEISIDGHGMCEVRVNARKAGSTAEFDRYRVTSVTY